jgi:hypothetical protein
MDLSKETNKDSNEKRQKIENGPPFEETRRKLAELREKNIGVSSLSYEERVKYGLFEYADEVD